MFPQKVVTHKSVISTDFRSILRVAWSPDSQYFAVLQTTGTTTSVVVYRGKTHEIVKELTIKKSGYYSGDQGYVLEGGVAFSPDGRYLAGGVGIITLWDAKTWQPVRDILGPFSRGDNAAGDAKDLAFSHDSQTLAILYEMVLWPESLRSNGRADLTRIAEARKTDKSIQNNAAIMVFDVESTKRLFLVKEESTENRSVIFSAGISYSPDGKYLLSSQFGNIMGGKLTKDDDPSKYFTYLKFRDPATGNVLKEIADVHVMEIEAAAFSHDGHMVATGTITTSRESTINNFTQKWFPINNKDPIRLWDVASGEKLMEFGPLRGAVRALAFTPDNKILVSCQTDIDEKETIWLWDVASGQLIERVSTPKSGTQLFSCAMSPDGHTIALPVLNKIYLISI